MKKLLAATALASVAVLTLPGAADAAARPSWSSSGLSGVQASGNYSRTGDSVHFYGRLYDTAGDSKSVRLLVRFTGECCAKPITNSNGVGTSVPIDLSSTRAPHVEVKELKGGGIRVWEEGPWVRIY